MPFAMGTAAMIHERANYVSAVNELGSAFETLPLQVAHLVGDNQS
jgi:hypothetical protein